MKVNKEYKALLQIQSITELNLKEQIETIGKLFDFSSDYKHPPGIDLGLQLSEQIIFENLSTHQQVLFHYYVANGWSLKRQYKSLDFTSAWDFNMLEFSKEIFHLRKSISLDGFETIGKDRQCQILTNLGNTYNFIGRFVEAQETWSKVLALIPTHSIALANKGKGLYYYGKYLFDESHATLFFIYAFETVRDALKYPSGFYASALKDTSDFYTWLEKQIPKNIQENIPNLNTYNLGKQNKIKNYRLWCLNNQLYINPINDLGSVSIASHDSLNLPTLQFEYGSPPTYLTLYNQMKQEFGTARFIFYESLKLSKPHFSDKDIVIVDTYENALHAYSHEQAKIAFRLAYSILDKIAFFLNDYFKLGIDASKINYRTIWYKDIKKRELRDIFIHSSNWGLRGLFWVSKDLHMSWEFNEVVIEPEAREIAAIRNHIEHKFFKLVTSKEGIFNLYEEEKDISYCIERKEFDKKILKLLKLVRAGLIYLSLAVNQEEKTKEKPAFQKIPILPDIIPFHRKK